MLALMRAQIDASQGHVEEVEESVGKGFLVSGQRDHASVVIPVRLHVEHPHARDAGKRIDGRLHDLQPPSLADVRHRLDDAGHGPSIAAKTARIHF